MLTDPAVLREIQHRDDLPAFLNRHGLTGYATELGTFKGDFAETILKVWTGKRLSLIDPYRHFPAGEYVDGSAIEHPSARPVDFEAMRWGATVRLTPYPAAHFIRKTSADAVTQCADGELDLVFVDANHSFNHVTEDIRLWWPKIIQGGIMGLHDCYCRDDQHLHCGVFDAVMDFSAAIGQRPRLTGCTTAWFLKL